MLKEALQKFAASDHGKKAITALQEKAGLSPSDAEKAAGACTGADCSGHDPIGGLAADKLGELVASHTGMSKETAQKVAGVVSPFVTKYVQEHLGAQSNNAAPPKKEGGLV